MPSPTSSAAGPRPAASPRSPGLRTTVAAGSAALVAALLLALLALGFSGALSPAALLDPGPLVRYGLPVVRVVHDLAAAVTVGGFVLAAGVLPHPSAAWTRAVRLATIAAGTWTLAALLVLVLTAMDVLGAAPGAPGFGAQLAQFATEIDLGRALLATTVLAAVVATVGAATTGLTGSAWSAVGGVLALLPLSLSGHAAGSASHMTAVSSLGIHLVAVTIWVGGLVTLLAVMPLTGARRGGASGERSVDLAAVTARYSTLALWCFGLVGLSGVVNAGVRLGGFSALTTPYGLLVLGKVVLLLALAAFGVWHRRVTIARLGQQPGAFARLAAVEVVVMGAALGLGVALSRSPTPVPDTGGETSQAAELLGEAVPPPLSTLNWFTQVSPDLIWLIVGVVALVGYLVLVRRLHRRGDAWPVNRTLWWVLGCLLLLFVTSGGPAAYGRISFSTHMLQHMLLTMAVPVPLVLGAPVTLAMRTLPARRDGSQGLREWLLVVVHSRFLTLVGHPLVAAVLFAGSLIVFYYSPLFELALRTHVGHELMMLHFIGTGYLFASCLIGVDPGPQRPPYPLRLILLLATMGFHAFFGVALMQGTGLLAADWFAAVSGADGPALLADQQKGGGIAWGIGEVPTILLVLAVAVSWSRSDTRENRRRDRAADRDGDNDLTEYNAMLARMAERDRG